MHRPRLLILAVGLGLPALAADAPDASAPVSFRADVAPILVKSCIGCHNHEKAENGLNMATFALLKEGGKTGREMILEPGDPDASGMIELVRPDGSPRMPYKLPALKDEQIRILERWVKQGAKFDGPSESETLIASLVDPLKGLPKIEVRVPTSDPVAALAFSVDGKLLAAGQGRDVLLFDPGTGKLLATLADHPGPITAVRITPDGKTLIAAGGRPGMFGAVTIWDLEKRTRRAALRGHTDSILSADLSPDGKLLATGSYDRLIKLWDVAKGAESRTLKEHTDAVYAVAFSPDGKLLASAGADRTVKLWDLASGKRLRSFSDATAEVYAVAFGPGGKTVLAAGADRSIRAWTFDDKQAALAQTAFGHDAAILRLLLSPDGKTVFSSSEDRTIKAWDPEKLKPLSALPKQSDWPLAVALSPDGSRLAVGRYDGSLGLLDAQDGKVQLALREAPGAKTEMTKAPSKPELVPSASLNPPSPRGATRGTKLRVTLTGTGVGEATSLLFAEPGLEATLVPAPKPDRNRVEIDLAIAVEARPGIHRFGVQTPLGVTPFQSFAVARDPEVVEAEPNDQPAQAKVIKLPTTLLGAIDKPGDVDQFRFEVKEGQQLVFETIARGLGSGLNGTLMLADEEGHILAEAQDSDGSLDPLLTYTAAREGTLTLRVVDADFGGSGNHFYRIQVGPLPYVASTFPLGIERGKSATIAAQGSNLEKTSTWPFSASDSDEPGTIHDVLVAIPDGSRPLGSGKIVVAEGPQAVESEGNDEPGKAGPVAVPGGISGRIGREGDVDHFRFEAKKGRRLIVEVYGRRLGSPIDPVIEILDAQGRTVPRAVLRPVAETFVAFRDHPSTGRGIRLTQWDDLAVGDYLLMGRELTRMFALPRNPDDDAIFWGNGSERVAFLETTPEHHSMGQPIYKVEIHPPGSTFPSGGVPPVTLAYRNDDGGPGLSKDARVTFDPPADGTYVVRVEDVRGSGGDRFGYHLVVRTPAPDFRFSVSTDNPNIPRGGTTLVTVNLTRIDGFDGPVEVQAEGLPPGVSATTATIERNTYSADLLLTADASAPETSPPTWRLKARALLDTKPGSSEADREIRHEFDPGGTRGGLVTVTPAPDLKIAATPDRVVIRPGERVEVKFAVERNPGLGGRVPIDVRNLPRGVRVLNIGLNGVLVTEAQTERTVVLYAEPWVEPMDRRFYASGRLELLGKSMGGNGAPVIGSSREHVSPPIELVVRPSSPGPQASAAAVSP